MEEKNIFYSRNEYEEIIKEKLEEQSLIDTRTISTYLLILTEEKKNSKLNSEEIKSTKGKIRNAILALKRAGLIIPVNNRGIYKLNN